MSTLNLYSKILQLPVHVQKEASDFIEFLFSKYNNAPSSKKKATKKSFKFDWEGALRNTQNSSVELQHKAHEWRNT